MRPENWAVFSVPKFFHFAGESKNQPFFTNNHVATADDFVEPSTTATAPDYTQKERTMSDLLTLFHKHYHVQPSILVPYISLSVGENNELARYTRTLRSSTMLHTD
jgi:hypothetical protein